MPKLSKFTSTPVKFFFNVTWICLCLWGMVLAGYPGQSQVYLVTQHQFYALSLPDLTLIRDFGSQRIEQISLSPNRNFAALVSFGPAQPGAQLWVFGLSR